MPRRITSFSLFLNIFSFFQEIRQKRAGSLQKIENPHRIKQTLVENLTEQDAVSGSELTDNLVKICRHAIKILDETS